MNNLILSGGISHPFDESSAALATLFAEPGITSTIFDDIDQGLAALATGDYAMLTVNALRWTMQGEKYDPHRQQWAFSLSRKQRQTIDDHVSSGGALFGLHTASICFDDWPRWQQILGGQWQWGQSWHPPLGTVQARMSSTFGELDVGTQLAVEDEVYTDLRCESAINVLLESVATQQQAAQPLAWQHTYGSGKVFYDALGHDAQSINQTSHAQLIKAAARWLRT